MTNDELNRKISETKGWIYVRTAEACSTMRKYIPAHRQTGVNPDTGSEDWLPDWTGSEEANAVLLEEMPHPTLFKFLKDDMWICHPLGTTAIEAGNPDRKVAIALAWLKWKGL